MKGLDDLAQSFAQDLSDLVSAFVDRTVPFVALTKDHRTTIQPESKVGVPLTIHGEHLLTLELRYRGQFDHQGKFLAVRNSQIKVHGGRRIKGEPLFRYDYVRDQPGDLPCSHVQVHAHRDQFTAVMAIAGQHGVQRRSPQQDDPFEVNRLSSLHFPVGGPRFRPALEDILQMLNSEFGADAGPLWAPTLAASRERYRRSQTGACVRDCPDEAIRVLRGLGFTIEEPPSGTPPGGIGRLTRF